MNYTNVKYLVRIYNLSTTNLRQSQALHQSRAPLYEFANHGTSFARKKKKAGHPTVQLYGSIIHILYVR